jgi:hypothetical protein
LEKLNHSHATVKGNPSESRVKFNTPTGTEKVLSILRAAGGSWVPAPALSRVSLAYTRSILENRRLGYIIENRVQVVDGVRHGYYRLIERRADNSAHVTLWQGEPAQREPEQQPLIESKPVASSWTDPEQQKRRRA